MAIAGYNNLEFGCGVVLIFVALVSLISTLITIWLIYDMKKRNGYLLTILTLTICQLLFDLEFSLVPFYDNDTVAKITIFINIFSSVMVSLWTNVISTLLFRIFSTTRSMHIMDYYFVIFGAITLFSLVLATTMTLLSDHHDTYIGMCYLFLWVKIVSILFNIWVHLSISRRFVMYYIGVVFVHLFFWFFANRLREMGFLSKDRPANDPIVALSARIKYYPLVQIIAVSGSALYEIPYGFTPSSYENNSNTFQNIMLFYYAFTYPLAGFGYFIVFLLYQPRAYSHLKDAINRLCCGASKRDGADIASNIFDTENDSKPASHYTASSASERSESLLGRCDEMDEDELMREIESKYLVDIVQHAHPHDFGNEMSSSTVLSRY